MFFRKKDNKSEAKDHIQQLVSRARSTGNPVPLEAIRPVCDSDETAMSIAEQIHLNTETTVSYRGVGIFRRK